MFNLSSPLVPSLYAYLFIEAFSEQAVVVNVRQSALFLTTSVVVGSVNKLTFLEMLQNNCGQLYPGFAQDPGCHGYLQILVMSSNVAGIVSYLDSEYLVHDYPLLRSIYT